MENRKGCAPDKNKEIVEKRPPFAKTEKAQRVGHPEYLLGGERLLEGFTEIIPLRMA